MKTDDLYEQIKELEYNFKLGLRQEEAFKLLLIITKSLILKVEDLEKTNSTFGGNNL